MRKQTPKQGWVIFIGGALCIAAVGLCSHFYDLQKKERDKRIAAEERVKTLTSQLRLLEEKNQELAEQLQEAKKIAEQLAREKETAKAATEISSLPETGGKERTSQEKTQPQGQDVAKLTDAVNALRLQRAMLAASRVKESAQGAWRAVRGVLVSSARRGPDQGGSVSTGGHKLACVMRNFPVGEFGRLGAEVKDSARRTLGAVKPLFSFQGGSSTAAVSPGLPPPSDGSKKLTATNEELRQDLAAVRREKRELEMQIAQRTGRIPNAVDVGKVRITTGRRFSGKVLVVNQKYNFVVVDIGKDQGLEKGEVLIVHRGNTFIGKTQVIKVYEKMAAADLIPDWMQDEVQVNDGVKKF